MIDQLTIENASLSIVERSELDECELIIASGERVFVTVGNALLVIRDKRLYREDHGTFEQYLTDKWPNISRRRAYQLMDAATVAGDVKHVSHPLNERQALELVSVSPEERPIILQRAIETAPNGKVTAAHVEQTIKDMHTDPVNDVLDPPMELEQVADQFPGELTQTDRELLEEESALDSNEWYTPVEFIDAARAVMGSIDVDPASNDTAQEFIQAGTHYTKETNGLAQEWRGNVWLNPPYAEPLPWIEKLLAEFDVQRTKQAILLVNTANSPQWSRLLWHSLFTVCMLDRRVRFWRPDRAEAKGTAQDQMIWYIGFDTEKFREVFESFGAIR